MPRRPSARPRRSLNVLTLFPLTANNSAEWIPTCHPSSTSTLGPTWMKSFKNRNRTKTVMALVETEAFTAAEGLGTGSGWPCGVPRA